MTKREYHNHFLRTQQNRERIFAPKIYRELKKQLTQTAELINGGLPPYNAVNQIDNGNLYNIILSLYIDAARIQGAFVQAQIRKEPVIKKRLGSIGFSERMAQLVTQYYSLDILDVCNGITRYTKERIIGILDAAYEQQLSINEIVDRINDLSQISQMRARRIARTETVTAANKGLILGADEMGLLYQKEWLATYDKRTRHDHSAVNGQVVAQNEYYTLPGGIKMLHPGDRGGRDGNPKVPAKEIVNCRCTQLVKLVRDANGRLGSV